ncbi:glycosyltransferase [Methanobacterium petrolearium]|uniref:glycosyltransferase n=1 Tax=Methanobacterium petrolearium TaxID=710190 RepID=UPI0031830DB7
MKRVFFFISSIFKLNSMVRHYNIEIIHSHFLLPPGLIGVLVGKITGIKTAVTAHGSDLLIQSKNLLLRRLIKYVLCNADYVLVVNNKLKEKACELGVDPENIHITPNAVNITKFNPENKELPSDIRMSPDKPVILFVGNLVFQKGVEYLLDAKKLMNCDAKLVIVGDGPLRRKLEKKVEENNISDVIFVGARRDIDKIMPSADLFVLPSISEGFPITILEALASGLPVVATNVGGISEVVDDSVGLIVKPSEPHELAMAMDKILENGELTNLMSVNARKHAMKYASFKIPY